MSRLLILMKQSGSAFTEVINSNKSSMSLIMRLSIILVLLTFLSCSSEYYSLDDFNKVQKIDTHMHLNSEQPALTEQAQQDNFRLLTVNVDVPDAPIDDQERFAIHQINLAPD